ncbi:alanine racemase [Lactococcus protaetiae]|uniref:Alanine racemase n=1 Tax=Lactococcus protaetiae TaxID=2592653 RepID=A0A514ZAD1_9LACT|nr:alanine racemase [Lactococcus protaetiae]MCL2114264.1 alanine racemase [Streptococcaceae bacterium]QDK71539.1 alanine racemase [Lactococcus protaetiae]
MKSSPHRHTPAVIDLAAIQNNIKKFRKHIGTHPEIWGVVKANAYGHGSIPVSQAIHDLVDGFCVSNLDEAIELRNHLITKPILVLSGIVPDNVDIAASLNITLTAPSLEWLQLIVKEKADFSTLKLHIAVDSGMGRIGVRDAKEANDMIALADKYHIQFDGVFTHFATADEADDTKFNEQKMKFDKIVSNLSRRPHYVHSTNTASALWHTNQVQDIERLGVSMYGLNPSGTTLELPFELEAAFSLKSELTHIKEIHAGDTLGYGATYRATENTWIGTVSIGYADGWTRDMQGFHVLVDGKFCEIVGRVSMDQMMIKLDKSYSIGTPVTLIGRDGDNEITAQDIAAWRKTINYEVLCLLSDRIHRVYK